MNSHPMALGALAPGCWPALHRARWRPTNEQGQGECVAPWDKAVTQGKASLLLCPAGKGVHTASGHPQAGHREPCSQACCWVSTWDRHLPGLRVGRRPPALPRGSPDCRSREFQSITDRVLGCRGPRWPQVVAPGTPSPGGGECSWGRRHPPSACGCQSLECRAGDDKAEGIGDGCGLTAVATLEDDGTYFPASMYYLCSQKGEKK